MVAPTEIIHRIGVNINIIIQYFRIITDKKKKPLLKKRFPLYF